MLIRIAQLCAIKATADKKELAGARSHLVMVNSNIISMFVQMLRHDDRTAESDSVSLCESRIAIVEQQSSIMLFQGDEQIKLVGRLIFYNRCVLLDLDKSKRVIAGFGEVYVNSLSKVSNIQIIKLENGNIDRFRYLGCMIAYGGGNKDVRDRVQRFGLVFPC